MDAIVYTSNSGFTAHYSQILAEKTGFPLYSLDKALASLPAQADIIYLGWQMAGRIKGYGKANRLYKIKAVCAVGMGKSFDQKIEEQLRERHKVPASTPLYVLQGGFDMDKLHGIYKLMMTTMRSTVGKTMTQKQDKTAEEIQMEQLLFQGGDLVKAENLQPLLTWLEENNK